MDRNGNRDKLIAAYAGQGEGWPSQRGFGGLPVEASGRYTLTWTGDDHPHEVTLNLHRIGETEPAMTETVYYSDAYQRIRLMITQLDAKGSGKDATTAAATVALKAMSLKARVEGRSHADADLALTLQHIGDTMQALSDAVAALYFSEPDAQDPNIKGRLETAMSALQSEAFGVKHAAAHAATRAADKSDNAA